MVLGNLVSPHFPVSVHDNDIILVVVILANGSEKSDDFSLFASDLEVIESVSLDLVVSYSE